MPEWTPVLRDWSAIRRRKAVEFVRDLRRCVDMSRDFGLDLFVGALNSLAAHGIAASHELRAIRRVSSTLLHFTNAFQPVPGVGTP